ncbi:MAG: DUF1360 domain-containing protein [Acidimicrobiales bacterium]
MVTFRSVSHPAHAQMTTGNGRPAPDGEGGPAGGVIGQVRAAAAEVGASYSHGEDRPLRSYAAAMAVYGTVVGSAALVARRKRLPLPERISAQDLALIAVATHKLSRTIAKDAVTSPLRAPFTQYKEAAGAGELNEEVTAEGWAHGIGELLSCPFCLAQWVATGFVGGLVVAPRATRLVASVFAARAGSDMLQWAYTAVEHAAA